MEVKGKQDLTLFRVLFGGALLCLHLFFPSYLLFVSFFLFFSFIYLLNCLNFMLVFFIPFFPLTGLEVIYSIPIFVVVYPEILPRMYKKTKVIISPPSPE